MAPPSPTLINPPAVTPPKPTYTHVVTYPISPTSTLITISGQIGINSATSKVPPTYPEQVECALANLGECLKAAGASPKNVIKVTHYIVNYDVNDSTRAEAYCRFMGDHRPASTLVGVACLAAPELLYEIEALAIVSRENGA